MVDSQHQLLERWKPSWLTRLRIHRYLSPGESWVRSERAPLHHIGGHHLDEACQFMLAGIGAASHVEILPRRSGNGLLLAMPKDHLARYRRWESHEPDVITPRAEKYTVEQVRVALTLRCLNPDAEYCDLLEAATVAT